MNHANQRLVPSLVELNFEPMDRYAYPLYRVLQIHVERASALTLCKSLIEI